MIGSTLTRPLAAVFASMLAIAATAALADTTPQPASDTDALGAATASADGASCAPGGLGDGGTYLNKSKASGEIVRAEIAYQCNRTLADGTYVPEGYRVKLFRACDSGTCEMPFVFATAGKNETYSARVEDGGEPMMLRFKENKRGSLVLTAVSNPGNKGERERDRYTLTRQN
jgi:hypothetical protein